MAKKNYYYVLVFDSFGPRYVTGLGEHQMAFWDADKDPMDLGKSLAEDVTFGLRCNWFNAVTVCTPVKLEGQPYRYDEFEIEWKRKNKEE